MLGTGPALVLCFLTRYEPLHQVSHTATPCIAGSEFHTLHFENGNTQMLRTRTQSPVAKIINLPRQKPVLFRPQ